MLAVRKWVCQWRVVSRRSGRHAARNMLSAGRSPPSVRGNESSFQLRPPEPDIPSMRGKDQRAENGGVSTGRHGGEHHTAWPATEPLKEADGSRLSSACGRSSVAR